MKRLMLKLSALLLFALCSITAHAAVLNFEDLTGQDSLPANYGGLIWGSGWTYYDWAQYPYTPASGTVRVYNSEPSNTFAFSTPTVFDGAYFAGEAYNISFSLYMSGNLVHTSAPLSLSSTPAFLSSGYLGVVDEIHVNGSSGYFVMDDVTFNSGQVPEPETWGMLTMGLAAVGALRRRKQ